MEKVENKITLTQGASNKENFIKTKNLSSPTVIKDLSLVKRGLFASRQLQWKVCSATRLQNYKVKKLVLFVIKIGWKH